MKNSLTGLVCCALLAGFAPAGVAQTPAPEDETDTATPILDWPRVYGTDGNETVVYQPQIDEWEDYAVLRARSAIVVTPVGAAEPQYGMIAMEARTRVDYEAREVLLDQLVISEVLFPGLDAAEAAPLSRLVHAALPLGATVETSLDRLLAAVERSQQPTREIEVNLEPPPIYHSDEPAILVMFMGEPRFEEVEEGSGLLFAVNTNWDLFLDVESARCYLLVEDTWLATDEPKTGTWTGTGYLPASFMKLPDDENWAAAREHAPPRERAPSVPRVFVTTEPAELVVTEGAPQFAPIPGTQLLAVANTESDLFRHTSNDAFYLLVAGRWFRAASLDGPWSAATTDLPADFASIPEDDPYASVLASVPGTPDAEAAVLLASVPRKATVNRNEAKIDVVYEGDPVFRLIEGTTVMAAANTEYDVFEVDQVYYCCHQSVWFAATSPHGPWVVWDDVPDAIYRIPPSSPKHNVTYVKVYESTPETVVVGHTSGYTGEFIAGGVVLFGLGYVMANADWHIHYHPHYYSYGCAARYDYHYGGYYRAAHVYGPYGGAGAGGRVQRQDRHVRTRRVPLRTARRRGRVPGVQPVHRSLRRTCRRRGTVRFVGAFGRIRGQRLDPHRSPPGRRGGAAAFETSGGAKGIAVNRRGGRGGYVVKDKHGDLYVGRKGDVHRRSSDGSWNTRSGRSWAAGSTDRGSARGAASSRHRDLERQRQARDRGNQRAERARGIGRRDQRTSGSRTGGRSRGGGGRRGGRR